MKTVLIDMSHLGSFCGFGEIAKNYGACIANMAPTDLRIVVMVPQKYKGAFGDRVEYISKEHPDHDLRALGVHVDLWHTTDQLFKYRRHDKGMIKLLTIHDLNFLYEKHGIQRIKHIWRMWWRVRRSDYVTAISQYAKKDLLAHVKTHGKEVRVIYNGVQDSYGMKQEKPAFVKDEHEKFFFTIGQIRKKKNFHTLVPMMKYFPDHKLYICGDKHFRYRKELESVIAQHGEGRVLLSGKISDGERNWLFAHAEAFLFPSSLEGFGIPVLEAMRFNCMVFSSRMSSLPEICDKHAHYFDSLEPEAMAQTVKDGIASWSRDSEEARRAREYSEGFNYAKYTQQYFDLYRELLAKGK